jgi:AcrR family transcriptional regulator
VTRMSAVERREKLVDAAIRVMTRDGVARATTRAIAAEAGMPLGVFHYAFQSKQELIAMVTETISQRSKADIDDAVLSNDPAEDWLAVALAGLCAYFDHVVAHPDEHLVTYELAVSALRDPELRDAARRQFDYYLSENEKLLVAAAELFDVEYAVPVGVLTRLMFSLMDGLALNWLAKGDEEEARQVVALAGELLVSQVRPRLGGGPGV